MTDKNLFAYCDNNPVVRVDLDRECWNDIAGAVIGEGSATVGPAGVSLVGSGVGKAVEKVEGEVATKALAKMPKSKLKATVTYIKP